MSPQKDLLKKIDKPLVLLYLAMIFLGWMNIYAAEYSESHQNILDISQNYGKQLIWIMTSLLLAIVILSIDAKFFTTFAYIFYGIVIFLLVAVLAFGTEVNASKSWFQIGFVRIQPAEFSKFVTALALAKYVSSMKTRAVSLKTKILPYIMIAIPMGFIFLQNDTGSALVFAAFSLVLYREGLLSGWLLLFGLVAVLLFVLTLVMNEFYVIGGIVVVSTVLLYFVRKRRADMIQLIILAAIMSFYVYSVDYAFEKFLQPHQKERITVLLGENVDAKGAGYNLAQSKIAIGSGGFWGKGFLNGTQTKFNFVPEQGTDFIFCTVGEEWGFMGSLVVILLFMTLLVRIIILSEKQRSHFSRVYGYSIASILFLHFLINIGMTIGLVPVIGIPLPFFSYGGSSLWGFTIMLFVFIKLDSKRLDLL